jgi:hypothetical protein
MYHWEEVAAVAAGAMARLMASVPVATKRDLQRVNMTVL